MSDRAVEKHITSVFQKLGLSKESDLNRPVSAVLVLTRLSVGDHRPKYVDLGCAARGA